ncbi:prolyl oligopeptidase family serine peptidase [Silvibacterium acidisoli]|uniref:prolyl oligopeptidase family serine peptidase n=1 Tax=Acidobacteriaceae bacterium ZG23-2 TaxID=2883246 RepID=UPI00406C7C57
MRFRTSAAVPLLAISLLSSSTSAFSQSQGNRIPEILSSLGQAKSISETAISPDSDHLAWIVSGAGIQLAPTDYPARAKHVTACSDGQKGEEAALAWSPDSSHLAFLSNCTVDHRAGVFLTDADGKSAPKLLVQLNGNAEDMHWSPDGHSLAFLYVEGATRHAGALAAMKPPAGVIGEDGIEIQRVAMVSVPEKWDGKAAGGSSSGATLRFLTPDSLHAYEFDWAPDAKKIAYIAAPPPGENNWWVAKLYTQSLDGEPKVLVDPAASGQPTSGAQLAVPRWSPDGSHIAFISGLMSDQGINGGDIYTIPSAGGEIHNLTPDWKSSPSWFQWTGNEGMLISEIKDGASHIFLYDIASQKESTEENITLPATVRADDIMLGVSVSEEGIVALERNSFDHPPEVWAGKLNKLRQMTHYNDQLKPLWGKAESVTWENEGFHVQGWLIYPADYQPGRKYPLVVYVHGGPSYANLQHWPSASYGGTPFAALGYFVLMPNPRGSYGEGEKFTQANKRDFGHGDLRDILAGVDTVTRRFPVDPERVGITGWSYGGFMTMFSVTQTTRFRAAVAGAGISNWQSYYGENSIDQWMIPFFGASVYDDPGIYAQSSAIDFIKKVKTPTLVVVGDRDGECPAPQSFEFWHALRAQHVPTQLVVYPNEGHGFVDPAHKTDVLERALAWFEKYMPPQ